MKASNVRFNEEKVSNKKKTKKTVNIPRFKVPRNAL